MKKRTSTTKSKTKTPKQYTTPDGEALELDAAWFAEATYHPGNKAQPARKAVSLRIDVGVIDYFKSLGPGYQTRMLHVLTAYVRTAKKRPAV